MAPVRPPKAERRPAAGRRNHAPEAREVYVPKLALSCPVRRLQVAQTVERVERRHAAPALAEARRIQGMTVREHRGAGGSAVADISISAGAVRLADPEVQAVVGVGVGVGDAARRRQTRQAVFVVIGAVVAYKLSKSPWVQHRIDVPRPHEGSRQTMHNVNLRDRFRCLKHSIVHPNRR